MNVRKLLCSLTIGKDILIFLQDELVLISLIFYRVAFLRDRNPLRPTAICMSTRSIKYLSRYADEDYVPFSNSLPELTKAALSRIYSHPIEFRSLFFLNYVIGIPSHLFIKLVGPFT